MRKEPSIELIGEEPDLGQIRGELDDSIAAAGPYIDQALEDYNTRFCRWPGQSDDGRKHSAGLGENPFPWEGASDTKIRAADKIVNEQVALMMTAFAEGKVQAVATNLDSVPAADSVTTLMKWLFRVQLRGELELEVELAAQWRQTYGVAVLGIFWDQQKRLEMKTVTLEELTQAAGDATAQGDPGPMEMLGKLFDPLAREELVSMVTDSNPLLDSRQARKLLDKLAADGVMEFPEVSVFKSLPCWTALRPWIDVFYPANTKSMKTARWVARRRWMTESDLKNQAELEGWDSDWVEEVLSTARGMSSDLAGLVTDWDAHRANGFLTQEFRDYVEILDWYQKGLDEKTGQPALYHTVFCPGVHDNWGKHELFAYKHGEMPFIELVRERTDVAMSESRSVPEIAATWQNEIKAQRDARTDHASIVTMPPLIVPPNKGKTRLEFGPGVQHTERRSGEIRWMDVPPYSQASLEAEKSATADADSYFARFGNDVSPMVSQMAAKKLSRDFLNEIARGYAMTLQLCQQYMPDTLVQRVAGPHRVPVMLSREDIRGQFALTLTFDVEQLDPALVKSKLEMFQTFILMADTSGVVDRGKYVKWAARLISPEMADELVGDPEEAAQSEVADEAVQFAKMVAGVEPEMKDGGQNYQLRLQALQGYVTANPEVQQMIQGRPVLQKMIENRIKHFQFMIQQKEVNPQIGRVGATPTLGVQG